MPDGTDSDNADRCPFPRYRRFPDRLSARAIPRRRIIDYTRTRW